MRKSLKTKYLLLHELEIIIGDMGDAMRKANVKAVFGGHPTAHMYWTLERFYDWAQRADKAGL